MMTTTANPTSSLSSSTHECMIVGPIAVEELDKTDKIVNLFKIGETIGRGVSFVKKTLHRNNNPNVLPSSSHDSVSSDDSFISLDCSDPRDMNLSDHAMSDSPLKPLRSCLKGSTRMDTSSLHCSSHHSSQHSSHSNHSSQHCSPRSSSQRIQRSSHYSKRSDKKRLVRFRKRTKEYKVEPFFEYASDLWYTTPKEKASLLSPQLETTAEMRLAEKYMAAYTCARKQVYPKEWFAMKEPKALTTSTYTKMLTASYDDIVYGRKNGFAGLENYSAKLKTRRTIHIRYTVLLICATYRELKSNDVNILQTKTKSSADWNVDGTLTNDAMTRLVRQYSKSLTEGDRYWAAAMGQVDHETAMDVYQHDTEIVATRQTHRQSHPQQQQQRKRTTPTGNHHPRYVSEDECGDDDASDEDDIEEFY
jgi:hypothetical protein